MPVLNSPDGSPISNANPLPVSGSLTLSGEVEVKNDAGSPLSVDIQNTSIDVNTGFTQPLTDAQLRASSVSVDSSQVGTWSVNQSGVWNVASSQSGSWTVAVNNFPATQVVTGSGTFNTSIITGVGTADNNPIITRPAPNTLCVSVTGATAAAVTATLPAAGAGLFHYIDAIEIVMYSTAARTGNATPVVVTTTNFPSTVAYTFPTAGAVGTITSQVVTTNRPIKSATANTNTTIVCPTTPSVIWRVNVYYSVGA